MIKGISTIYPVATATEYETLSSFFTALGFEPGRGWNNSTGRGASFRTTIGNLEITASPEPDEAQAASFFFEVTSLESTRRAAIEWLKANPLPASLSLEADGRITPVSTTTWKSDLFIVEPLPGHAFAFWAWNDPLKGKPVALEGDLSAVGMKFAIVVARWNAVITDRLLDGALDAILRSGAKREDIQIVRVPGAWEVPAAARTIANLQQVDAVITLGCLIRGETAHYEAIYNEVSRGIGQSQQETGIPHGFGILTCENLEQALNRAGIKAGNKGFEAAVAAIEMVSVERKIRSRENTGDAR